MFHHKPRVLRWGRFLAVQGGLLGSLASIGCSEHREDDPEISQAVQSRIKRLANSADDSAPAAKTKAGGAGQSQAR